MKIYPALLALALAPTAFAQAPLPHQGRWITESGNLEVEIAPCGNTWCGTVVKVLANRSMSSPGAEMKPADARPVLGLQLLFDLRPADEGELKGEIYNRENGKNYSTRVTLTGPDQLAVHSYVGIPLFGKTQIWRRAEVNAKAAP